MSPFDDGEGEMRGFPLLAEADAFFDSGGTEVPTGLEDVASLVRAANGPSLPDELVGEAQAVAALAAAVGGTTGISGPVHEGRRPMLSNILTAKVAAAAAAALFGGGAAAAATGSLPAPVQSTVSRGLAAVGVSVPNPDAPPTGGSSTTSHGQAPPPQLPAPTTAPVGPSVGSVDYGLCAAYVTGGSHNAGSSVANQALSVAAAAVGETVTTYCSTVPPPTTVPTTAPPTTPPQGSGTSGGAGTGSGEPTQVTEPTQPPEQTQTTETPASSDQQSTTSSKDNSGDSPDQSSTSSSSSSSSDSTDGSGSGSSTGSGTGGTGGTTSTGGSTGSTGSTGGSTGSTGSTGGTGGTGGSTTSGGSTSSGSSGAVSS